ncbi:MAG: PTS sugar transporter subunit IIA, partial [Candidatus Sumerlaeia bacterium]|nr:PTS sugar transporter subunit IIA [Candidatus Sumerlaeia bacterium]
MNIYEFISPDLVLLDISASHKQELFEKMVMRLTAKKLIAEPAEVITRLMEREKLISTGIKSGYAIPHCFTEQLNQSIVSFARLPEGIDYQALDGKPVFLIFLLLGPHSAQGVHLKLLARLARLMNIAELFPRLMDAPTPADVIEILKQYEHKIQPVVP